jgi:hypothetical protein
MAGKGIDRHVPAKIDGAVILQLRSQQRELPVQEQEPLLITISLLLFPRAQKSSP